MPSHIFTTKTFITILSIGATPKSLYAIKSGRQRALAPCDQLSPHNSRRKSGKEKSIPHDIHFFGATITALGHRSAPAILAYFHRASPRDIKGTHRPRRSPAIHPPPSVSLPMIHILIFVVAVAHLRSLF